MNVDLTPTIFRNWVDAVTARLAKMPPQFDEFEDDGGVIWLKKDGIVMGCAHRQQFYEICGEVAP